VVTLVLVTLLAVSRAQAGGSDDQGRAQALHAAGLKAMQTGDYREALARFEEAMSLVPSPRIAFDIGKAHLALGDDVQALEAFERFLEEAPGAPRSSRDEARRSVDALRPRIAYLEIQSENMGAKVLIDGYAVGTVPLPRPKVVKPGPHEIYVTLRGLNPYARTIFAIAGQ
jgi:tetratricopeptide (TPR) repeat protein